ncbi:hypothetical protein MHU86_15840 [Fragilaria crotonensis]|nr:hypothetical protein MHU86_15840 [Fragilaria crotonensis]
MQLIHHGFACNTDAGFSLAFAHGNIEDTTTFKTVDRDEMVAPAVVRNPDPGEDEGNRGVCCPNLGKHDVSRVARRIRKPRGRREPNPDESPEPLPHHTWDLRRSRGAKVISARDLAFAIIEPSRMQRQTTTRSARSGKRKRKDLKTR